MAQFSSISGDFFLVFIFLLPLLYFIFKQFKASSSSKNIPPFPPGPTPWPLLGNIPHLANKMPHIALSDLSKIHGPLLMLKLGTQKLVVASSPAAAKEILKTHDQFLSARYIPKSFSDPEKLNISTMSWTETCNEGWKLLRTLCRAELFSTKSLDAQSCMREKKISEMIEHIKKCKNDGEAVNIGELVFVTVFNMLSNVLLSSDLIIGFDGGMRDLFKKLAEKASAPNIADLYPIFTRFDLQGIRRYLLKTSMKVQAFYEPILKERRKANTPSSPKDFLDVLLLNKFTDPQIHKIIQELVSNGTDTTTSTVEWAMAELIKNPESMKNVIQELDKEVGVINLVKESHVIKLSYLQACVKETLRKHPPAPLLLPHRASETCQVMNYTIPKDSQVYVNIWAMGRDPSIWDEPSVFKPERFLNVAVDFKGNNFEFIPFGSGRRICPGLPMAGQHVTLILAVLLHSFDWSVPKGKSSHELDMTEKFGISLHKEQPLLLIPKPRIDQGYHR